MLLPDGLEYFFRMLLYALFFYVMLLVLAKAELFFIIFFELAQFKVEPMYIACGRNIYTLMMDVGPLGLSLLNLHVLNSSTEVFLDVNGKRIGLLYIIFS